MGCVGQPAGPGQPKKHGNRIESRLPGLEICCRTQVGQNTFQRFTRFAYFPGEANFPGEGMINGSSTSNHLLAPPNRAPVSPPPAVTQAKGQPKTQNTID